MLEAKPGDVLNISTIAQLFEGIDIFGKNLVGGILTITSQMNLPQIVSSIAAACEDAG